ncbi:MAG: M60 family metallopeptidase [Clostridiales bacterium]|jgi:hypothetical protein|nr:M60 family metallopeptidase [Clostridiales bacterium]
MVNVSAILKAPGLALVAIIAASAMLFWSGSEAFATSSMPGATIELSIGDPYMIANGVRKEIDPGRGTAPVIINDRTLLPVRAIFEEEGCDVLYDGGLRKVTILHEATGLVMEMFIGEKEMLVNGRQVLSDVAPIIINERTLCPFRIISETLGFEVEWNPESRSIRMGLPNNMNPSPPQLQTPAATPSPRLTLEENRAKITNGLRVYDPGLALSGISLLSQAAEGAYEGAFTLASAYSDVSDDIAAILQRDDAAVAVAGVYGYGKFAAFSHDGSFSSDADGKPGADELRIAVLEWLVEGKDKGKIGFAKDNGEAITAGRVSNALKNWGSSKGISFVDASLSSSLDYYDALIFGNPQLPYTQDELKRIESYISNGGCAVVLGLGWSWASYRNDPGCEDMPANTLGKFLGFKFESGKLSAPSHIGSLDANSVRVVYAGGKTDSELRAELASSSGSLTVLEGEGSFVYFSNELWTTLNNPKALVDNIDRIVRDDMEFIGSTGYIYANRYSNKLPFLYNSNTDIHMYTAEDHCGMSLGGARGMISAANAAGMGSYPDWVIGHEIGRAVVEKVLSSAISFNSSGMAWINVLNNWSMFKADLINSRQFMAGFPRVYYEEFSGFAGLGDAVPGDGQLTADAVNANTDVFVNLPSELVHRYGWDPMRQFFRTAAQHASSGAELPTDNERLQYSIRTLSEAYGMDLSELFEYCGLEVDQSTRADLEFLPKEIMITNMNKYRKALAQ